MDSKAAAPTGHDPFAATRSAYADPAAVAAYVARDAAAGPGRDASSRALLDGLDLTGLRALDMGCGAGGDVAWLRGRGALAHGVDASRAMLAVARSRHGDGGWWTEADMRAMRLTPWGAVASLDLVWSMVSLVHVARGETPGLLARWASWLRPGGRIAIATKQGLGESHVPVLAGGPTRIMVYRTPDEVVGPLEAAGLVLERLEVDRPSAAGNGERIMLVRMARR